MFWGFSLIDFPSFLSFKIACFSPKGSSLIFRLVYLFQHKCSLYRQNPRIKPRVGIQNNLLFKQLHQHNNTHLGNKKTPQSHVPIAAHLRTRWSDTKGDTFLSCLTNLDTNFSFYFLVFLSIISCPSFDLKLNFLQCIAKTKNWPCCSNTFGEDWNWSVWESIKNTLQKLKMEFRKTTFLSRSLSLLVRCTLDLSHAALGLMSMVGSLAFRVAVQPCVWTQMLVPALCPTCISLLKLLLLRKLKLSMNVALKQVPCWVRMRPRLHCVI